jgi:hypothetical protein
VGNELVLFSLIKSFTCIICNVPTDATDFPDIIETCSYSCATVFFPYLTKEESLIEASPNARLNVETSFYVLDKRASIQSYHGFI